MDTKLLLLLIAVTSVLAYSDETKKNIDDSDDEDYDYTYDDDSDEEISKKSETLKSDEGNIIKVTNNEQNNVKVTSTETTLKPATYEVTENVVDIPDNSTRGGPVVVNYTTPLPLNNANVDKGNKDQLVNSIANPNVNYGFIPPVNNANVPNTIGDPSNVLFNHKPDSPNTNYGFVDIDSEAAKTKKNYFSIFHVKAEYDDDKPSTPDTDQNKDRPSGFKEYILGLKRGIVNGLYKLFSKKHGHEETQDSVSNHNERYHKYPESHSNRFGHTERYYKHEEYD